MTRPRVLKHAATTAPATLMAAVIALGTWRAIRAWTAPPAAPADRTSRTIATDHRTQAPSPTPTWTLSERALAATLVDELFPPPPAEQPPPPPPRLDVQLVAILGSGDQKRAFVRDLRENAYLELAAGGRVRDEVRLDAIEDAAAVFTVAGEPVRLELAR